MSRVAHYRPQPLPSITVQEVTRGVLAGFLHAGSRFWTWVVVLGVLFILGIIGFLLRLQAGFEQRAVWGYYAVTFAYLLTTAQAAPLVSMATRTVKAHWRRPLARAAELFAVVGVLNFLLFLPLLRLLPPAKGRQTIWFEVGGAPHVWDTLGLGLLVVCGLAFLYFAALPDLATVRDQARGARRGFLSFLAFHWQGTKRQWRVLQMGLGFFGAFYLIMFVGVQSIISTDLTMSLVPGWKDAIYPAYNALSGLQAALALTLVTLFVFRTWGGYRDYLGLDQFWGLSKMLLALTLLWFYFWFSQFIIFWYGRQPIEQTILQLIMTGPYRWAFFLTFIFNFLVPFLLLISNAVRMSIVGPVAAGASVLVGGFLDRVRLYMASFSVGEVPGHVLDVAHLPATRFPEGVDLMIIVGGMAGAVLLYLLATKLIPPFSMWELKEGIQLTRVQRLLHREVTVLAKPE